MKKNNLKRFLASLLAVLMLSQVTGVAPGVFADWNSAATQSAENVEPVFQEYTGEVLIKSAGEIPKFWMLLQQLSFRTKTALTFRQSIGLISAP